MRALARFSSTRPWLVVISWIAIVAGLTVASTAVGPDLRDEFSLSDADSTAAYETLDANFPAAAGTSDQLVWSVDEGSVTDTAVETVMTEVLRDIEDLDGVAGVQGPYEPGFESQISPDGTVAIATVQYEGQAYDMPREVFEGVVTIVEEADGTVAGDADLTVALGGQGASRLIEPEVSATELFGLVAAAIILFLAFGSLVAMTLPIATAIVAVGGSVAALGLLSHVVAIASPTPVLAVLLGLGIGIDYALFVVNRYRGALLAGHSVDDAIATAVTTSGRSVVFAGITVSIALIGMFVPQISFLNGLAIGAMISVIFTVAASITVLPALLKLLGTRVLSRKHRDNLAVGRIEAEHAPRAFSWWARSIQRHPVVAMVAGIAILGALAIPTLSLRLGTSDQGNDPAGTTTRVAYDTVAEGFGPGVNGPLIVVMDLGDNAIGFTPEGQVDAATVPADVQAMYQSLSADDGVAATLGPIPSPDGSVAMFQVIPTTTPQDVATVELLERIRGEYTDAATSSEVHVGGTVASNEDFAKAISDALPLFFTIVIGVSVLVLIVAFRSLLVPVVGAVMNLLSAAAAFGVVVAVFQWGWLAEFVGVGDGGPIEPYVPVILFALLFGLSMDYQVFLVSRMAEEWHARRDNTVAVRVGHAEVGKVIVAAASIMVVVFGAFIFGDSRVIKLMGVGLAAAVAIDAFIIRMTVVPALMHLIGKANWWIPAWLDRILPHVDIEGAAAADEGAEQREHELEGARG